MEKPALIQIGTDNLRVPHKLKTMKLKEQILSPRIPP